MYCLHNSCGLKIKNKYHVFFCFVYCSKHRDVVLKICNYCYFFT
jgi:hypothetical protein